jgi:cytochrome oxidase assembly protein ShyY1
MALKFGQFEFAPDWKTTVFTLLLLPLLLSLGNWQLNREEEKKLILQQELQTAQAAPVSLPATQKEHEALAQFTRVELVGELRSNLFLLDNRISKGRVGYEVLQLMDTVDGHAVWINRGFVQAGRTRAELPQIDVPAGPLVVNAKLYKPYGEAYRLGDTPIDRRRNDLAVIQTIDLAQLNEFMHLEKSFPYELRLEEGSVAALETHWTTVNVDPAKHRGYAVQWFAMSCALIIFYVLRSLKKQE